MSRTIRRKHQQHEYRWVLRDWGLLLKGGPIICHNQQSPAGRKAIAIFHSDNEVTMRSSAPRWYRKIFDRQRRTRNNREIRKWLSDPDFDPVFECRHRHDAHWAWW